MLSFLSGIFLSLLASQAVARSQNLQIPEVQAAVDKALKDFSAYTAYNGPTSTASANVTVPTGEPRINVAQPAVADPPYWLANIKHQGRAAFNPDTTYTVWRNVMNFGAKGTISFLAILCFFDQESPPSQAAYADPEQEMV